MDLEEVAATALLQRLARVVVVALDDVQRQAVFRQRHLVLESEGICA